MNEKMKIATIALVVIAGLFLAFLMGKNVSNNITGQFTFGSAIPTTTSEECMSVEDFCSTTGECISSVSRGDTIYLTPSGDVEKGSKSHCWCGGGVIVEIEGCLCPGECCPVQ